MNPPFLRNHGNYIISLNQFVKWLGELVEKVGASVFAGFAGMEILYDGARVTGVRTDDKGVDKDGKPKPNYQPGYNLRAKVTVFAEGPRGSEGFYRQHCNHHSTSGRPMLLGKMSSR